MIDELLKISELRSRCLVHTREAYSMVEGLNQPQILDIGCGNGTPTLELATLSGGLVIGIDTDQSALETFRKRIEERGLSDFVSAIHCSLYDTEFPDENFDLLWEEGVLHLLDPRRSFSECHRLLKSGGFLVGHERIEWFETTRPRLPEFGFKFIDQHLLPKHFWWTDYGAPLEKRIDSLLKSQPTLAQSPEITRHKREVAAVKADPGHFDCGFFILQKQT